MPADSNLEERARFFAEKWEREHGYPSPPNLARLEAVAERLSERAFGRKRPTLTLVRGGRADAN